MKNRRNVFSAMKPAQKRKRLINQAMNPGWDRHWIENDRLSAPAPAPGETPASGRNEIRDQCLPWSLDRVRGDLEGQQAKHNQGKAGNQRNRVETGDRQRRADQKERDPSP